jgi:hypothetical protein
MEGNVRSTIIKPDDSMLNRQESDFVPRTPSHRQLGTNREFFVNTKTMISQWTRPFFARTYRSQDIDADSFIQVIILHDVFPRSPMLELLNLPAQDLWSNAESFYKQLKEKQREQEMKAAQAQHEAALIAAATPKHHNGHARINMLFD